MTSSGWLQNRLRSFEKISSNTSSLKYNVSSLKFTHFFKWSSVQFSCKRSSVRWRRSVLWSAVFNVQCQVQDDVQVQMSVMSTLPYGVYGVLPLWCPFTHAFKTVLSIPSSWTLAVRDIHLVLESWKTCRLTVKVYSKVCSGPVVKVWVQSRLSSCLRLVEFPKTTCGLTWSEHGCDGAWKDVNIPPDCRTQLKGQDKRY